MERGLLLAFADGPKNHGHVATILLGARLHDANLCDVISQTLQQTETELRARLLATTEHDGYLYLGTLLQEAHHVALFGLVIVIINLRTELLFLHHGLLLVLTSFAGLLGLLVLELAVVHDLCYGRLGVRCNLYKVEVSFIGQLSRIVCFDDTDLFAAWTDESDLRDSNTVVDASFCANVNSSVAVLVNVLPTPAVLKIPCVPPQSQPLCAGGNNCPASRITLLDSPEPIRACGYDPSPTSKGGP